MMVLVVVVVVATTTTMLMTIMMTTVMMMGADEVSLTPSGHVSLCVQRRRSDCRYLGPPKSQRLPWW